MIETGFALFMARTPHFVLKDTIILLLILLLILLSILLLIGVEQCLTDARVFLLIEEGHVTIIIAVVYVDDIFAVGLKNRGKTFRDELNYLVQVKNLGALCRYPRKCLLISW